MEDFDSMKYHLKEAAKADNRFKENLEEVRNHKVDVEMVLGSAVRMLNKKQ